MTTKLIFIFTLKALVFNRMLTGISGVAIIRDLGFSLNRGLMRIYALARVVIFKFSARSSPLRTQDFILRSTLHVLGCTSVHSEQNQTQLYKLCFFSKDCHKKLETLELNPDQWLKRPLLCR